MKQAMRWVGAFVIATTMAVTYGPAAAEAATVYVAPYGSDSNPGTIARPFKTISRAARAADPGTEVLVRGGTYRDKVVIAEGGNAGAPVRFRAYPGETPVLDGSALPPDTTLVQIYADHVEFRGFTVRNSRRTGITAWGTRGVVIADNTVSGSRLAGIWVGHSDRGVAYGNRITGNVVSNNCLSNQYRGSATGGWPGAIVTALSDSSVIERNHVYENYGEGIITLSSVGNVIENNLVHDNFSVMIYLDNAPATKVRGNIVYHRYKAAFYRSGRPGRGVQIANEYTDVQLPSKDIQVTGNVLGGVGGVTYGTYQYGGGLVDSVIAPNTVLARPESLW